MWDWIVLAAVLVGAIGILAALVHLAVRVLQAWRDLKRLRRHVAKELDRLADRLEALTDTAGRASDPTRLEERLDHLHATLGRFAVLRAALDEVTDAVGGVTAFIPSK